MTEAKAIKTIYKPFVSLDSAVVHLDDNHADLSRIRY